MKDNVRLVCRGVFGNFKRFYFIILDLRIFFRIFVLVGL